MQEKLKIKRCPCCGGDALLTVLANSNGRITAWVRCEDCGLSSEMYEDADDALAAWNKRYCSCSDLLNIQAGVGQ